MPVTPERFMWATELLNIKPQDKILEIGCGAGLLAEQIAKKLAGGQLTAIDRSVPMIEKAKKRNKAFIEKGVSSFLQSEFLDSQLPASHFNSIVAFNVNFFWNETSPEYKIIKKHLHRNGKLYIFHQSPFEIDIEAAQPIKKLLIENSFTILDVILKRFKPTSAFCIIAKP